MSQPFHVLLFEDDPDHAKLIRRALSKATGATCSIDAFQSLATGLEALKGSEVPYDVVLTDLNLPDSKGIDTCRKVADAAGDIPVIVLTSLEIEDQGIRAVQERAEDYLPKSKLDGDLLLRSIRCAIERAGRRIAESELHEARGGLEVARQTQVSMLPKRTPTIPGVDVAAISEQAEAVGGDYFDYLRLPSGDWCFVVGDASGHGPGAAMFMAQATACLRTLVTIFDDIGEILRRANDIMHRETPEMTFMSLQLIQYDAARRVLKNSSAGHGPSLLLNRDGGIVREFSSTGLLLGMAGGMDYPVEPNAEVKIGDTLVMVSDGVVEAASPECELFGTERLIETLQMNLHRSASDIVQSIRDAVSRHCAGIPPHDDLTALVVKWLS